MRHNIYAYPHKGLRFALAEMMLLIDQSSHTNAQSLQAIKYLTEDLIRLCQTHCKSEDTIVVPALKNRSQTDIFNHEKYQREHENIAFMVSAFGKTASALTVESSALEYADFGFLLHQLMAIQLQHMAFEEEKIVPLFQQYFTDEEFNLMHQQVMSSLSPEENLLWFKYVCPALSPQERTALIAMLNTQLPEESLTPYMEIARNRLSAENFKQIQQVIKEQYVSAPVA